MKYVWIASQLEAGQYPLTWYCSALKVSVSGFRDWCSRETSRRTAARQALTAQLRLLHQDHRGIYGSPRMHSLLLSVGIACSLGRVARTMKQAGLRGRKKNRRGIGTQRRSSDPVAENLLARRFAPGGLVAWTADITYIPLAGKLWLYLAVVISVYSRRVIGYATGPRPSTDLTLQALEQAGACQPPRQGQIHHSDQGSTYTSSGYRARVAELGMRASMSRKGDCYDNAVTESFFATLKEELLNKRPLPTRQEARWLINDYIVNFYNCKRLHSALGNVSPEQFEKLHPVLN